MAHDFNLSDFRRQLDEVEKSGTTDQLGRLSGLWALGEEGEDRVTAFGRIRHIIDAMTEEERCNPDRIDDDCRSRIAARSGTQPVDVAKVLAQFYQVREFMRQVAGLSLWQRIKMLLGFERRLPANAASGADHASLGG